MKLNKIQLLVYGNDLKGADIKFTEADIRLYKVHDTPNPSYRFIDIEIPETLKPGDYKIAFSNKGVTAEFPFPVYKRESVYGHKGFDQSDVIYLVTPDRFVNGDQNNDEVEGYINGIDRSSGTGRHGGDIQGVINSLDYIKETGFTTLWLNPVIENNTPVSYHGYGATDLYKVDPRFGTNEIYKKFVSEAHKRGLKVILDHVANHIHINHPWMKNLPVDGWVNHSQDSIEITRHDKMAIVDVHADSTVLPNSVTGWFTDYMPDLNQQNPFMANYLIQNTIWWMEYADIDAVREDTYPYADPEFMSRWDKNILEEYPNTNIVGEVWNGNPAILGTYQQKSRVTAPFDSNLPAVTDFGLSDIINYYLMGQKTISSVYETLTMDFCYYDPYNLLTFIDNHDIERAMFVAKGDVQKFKLAFQILLTTRGIPQIFYGTEIGLVGGKDHGSIRLDFPGGFPGDERNAFTPEGRTEEENDLYDFFKKLLKIRKESKALSGGKLIHLPPENSIYCYFRITEDEKIMVIVNDNDEEKEFGMERVGHHLKGSRLIRDLETGNEYPYSTDLKLHLDTKEVHIFKLIY